MTVKFFRARIIVENDFFQRKQRFSVRIRAVVKLSNRDYIVIRCHILRDLLTLYGEMT